MNPGGSGSRADNITTDQDSPKEGVDTLAEDDSAMTPRDAPENAPDDARDDDGPAPYRDEEE